MGFTAWRKPPSRPSCRAVEGKASTKPGGRLMPMPASEIETLIKGAFPDADVVIEDLRGDGDHYAWRVVCTAFAGKSRVQQHQMVYKALGGRMGGELHALALQTSAPTSN